MANENTKPTTPATDKAAAKPAKAPEFRKVEIAGTEDLPDWNFNEMGAVTGKLISVKRAAATFEGQRRPRTLCVVESEGEKVNVWLPEMHHDACVKCKGKLIRVEKSGEGMKDTRYDLFVA